MARRSSISGSVERYGRGVTNSEESPERQAEFNIAESDRSQVFGAKASVSLTQRRKRNAE